VVNVQNYVFYFESDIAKVFPFRPIRSSYDSEKKKVKKWAKKDQKRKWTNVANLD
jgi:L-rhamnose mutarotase